jgi:hypothetical protein
MLKRPAARISSARSAGWTYIFVGIHPRPRQVPPKTPRSTNATSRCANRLVDDRVPGTGPDDDEVVAVHRTRLTGHNGRRVW